MFFLLFKMATAPRYETLLTGIEPAETGKITKALDEQGIAYELQNGGTAIGVQKADAARARIALAEQGLPAKGQPGFELFDKQKLGTSDFQQQVNYQRALEGEIANTIEQVQGVSGAKVQLVLPEDQLFAEDAKPATAAVLLSGDACRARARAPCAAWPSSSPRRVEGLALDKVTITDGAGSLLWPKEGADAARRRCPSRPPSSATTSSSSPSSLGLLAGTVGADKARVQVSSTLNLDKAKERKLTYGDNGRRAQAPARDRAARVRGRRRRGWPRRHRGQRPRTTPPRPPAARASRTTSASSDNTELGVDKTVRDTEFAPGRRREAERRRRPRRVGPARRRPRDPDRRRVRRRHRRRAAATQLTVSRVAFAKAPAPPRPPRRSTGYLGYAKWAALGLGRRCSSSSSSPAHLTKREREALGEPVWLREITAPQSLAALEADDPRHERHGPARNERPPPRRGDRRQGAAEGRPAAARLDAGGR